MFDFYLFIFLIIISILFYINTISIIKKINNNKKTKENTILGCILISLQIYLLLHIIT